MKSSQMLKRWYGHNVTSLSFLHIFPSLSLLQKELYDKYGQEGLEAGGNPNAGGEGDLFGVDQSGVVTRRRVADFHKHSHILEKVYRDVQQLMREQPGKIDPILLKLARDQKILDTI
jgi:hypothetical protein